MNFSTVPCVEEHGSRQENYDSTNGWDASVALRVAWALRFDLIADLMLNERPWPQGGYSDIVALSAGMQPFGDGVVSEDGQEIVYDEAIVNVKYGGVGTTPSALGGAKVSESIEPIVQFQRLPHTGFSWSDGRPLSENEAPGFQRRSLNLVRQYFNATAPVHPAVLSLVGTCNEEEYTSPMLGMTFPAETLLYGPPQLSRTIKSDGTSAVSFTLRFSYIDGGWNKFWRANTSTHESIYDRLGVQVKPYPPGNFLPLLS